MISQIKNLKKLHESEQHIEYYQNEIKQDTKAYESLVSSDKNLEKFARETYKMKKADEEVFVIIPKEK